MIEPYNRFRYLMDSRYLYKINNPRVCDLEGLNHMCNECRAIRPVTSFSTNPFSEEIVGNYTMKWICDICYQMSCDDI